MDIGIFARLRIERQDSISSRAAANGDKFGRRKFGFFRRVGGQKIVHAICCSSCGGGGGEIGGSSSVRAASKQPTGAGMMKECKHAFVSLTASLDEKCR